MLVRLLYASRSLDRTVPQDMIDAILAASRANNPSQGITGVLCHGGDVFMQLLEGGRANVNTLYNRIASDPRHREVTILHYEEIESRRFAGWTMGQVNLGKLNTSLLLRYSEKATLDPYAVSGRASLALLEELMATAQIMGRVS